MMSQHRTRANEQMGTFSERFPVLYDVAGRIKKADKIISVCSHFSFRPLSELVCLDLGASTGIMTGRLAEFFRNVVALDLDRVGLRSGKCLDRAGNVEYICSDGTESAIADNSIDVVICNQIYEHVDNQEGLMSEIYRVLKYDGFCYFGAGNKRVLVEGHYFLPFLSWLPPSLADFYMKLAGKQGIYDIRLLSLGKLKKLTANFWIHDYTGMIFRHPGIFNADDVVRPGNLISKLPDWLYRPAYPFLPAWVWVLTKRK
jgi:ubiquinone/menaquinone biosynthesis C-methylase UbiE